MSQKKSNPLPSGMTRPAPPPNPPRIGRGDPLLDMIAAIPADDLERLANTIASAHQLAASRALQRGEKDVARFHQGCAGDVLRRAREAG